MATCQVLRCSNPAVHVLRLTPPESLLAQGVVCDDHHAAIERGAPWRWEPDLAGVTQGSILMGQDLDSAGISVTRFVGTEEHGLVLAHDGTPATAFVFERLLSDGSTVELRLMLNEEVIDQLHHTFTDWLRPSPDS